MWFWSTAGTETSSNIWRSPFVLVFAHSLAAALIRSDSFDSLSEGIACLEHFSRNPFPARHLECWTQTPTCCCLCRPAGEQECFSETFSAFSTDTMTVAFQRPAVIDGNLCTVLYCTLYCTVYYVLYCTVYSDDSMLVPTFLSLDCQNCRRLLTACK